MSVATLDEVSQSPRDVTVKRVREHESRRYKLPSASDIARLIEDWKDVQHPNVLGLLGYTLKHNNRIDQLIWPYSINGNIRDFLNRAPVGVVQRLGFVRDVTAGLAYLHGQWPPIWRWDLEPRNVLIDENLHAVLTNWGPYEIVGYSPSNYTSPESYLDGTHVTGGASDVWSWGCVVFEILTDKRPFTEPGEEVCLFDSFIDRRAPGRLDTLLDLVPDAPTPAYAFTLRLLHSYLPLCWDYKPRERPPISVLRRQVFRFYFEDDAGNSVVATLEELAHLLIPPQRLRIVENSELGQGNYGRVVLGTLNKASWILREVAVKRFSPAWGHGERVQLAKRLERELNIWAKTKHPNIVELIGYYLDEKYESPLLISALMVNGNVLNYIERHKPDVKQRVGFVNGITAGLAYLHSLDPPICHANLKPSKVLIDSQMNAVLGCFGLASFVRGSGDLPGSVTTTNFKGTRQYASPELLLESDRSHNLESDVWAWACTVFQVVTGRIPYAERTAVGQFYLAMHRKELPGDASLLLPNDAEDVDSESALYLRFLYSALPQCWDFDPRNRPSTCALLSGISNHSPQTGSEAGAIEEVATGHKQVQQGLSNLSSQREAVLNGNGDVNPGSLEKGTALAETSEDPSGPSAEVESARGDEQNESRKAHVGNEGADNGSLAAGQAASAINGDAGSEAQFGEDDKTVVPTTAYRSSLKIPAQLLISLMWAVFILSLSANIFLILRLLREADLLPQWDQEGSCLTYGERDL
ncbi:hypothetical protein FRC04_009549 [Tulasnella sp. 424]|nr:hypothetical protein FRC04_009549 [Tulasnella sp. 424]